MKTTRTVELTEMEMIAVQDFLKIVDEISDVANCSMINVCDYFIDVAETDNDGYYHIKNMHKLDEIG